MALLYVRIIAAERFYLSKKFGSLSEVDTFEGCNDSTEGISFFESDEVLRFDHYIL